MIEEYIASNYGNVHLKGFKYLVRVCELLNENKVKNLEDGYNFVAQELNITRHQVERNIRFYISKVSSYDVFKDVYCEEITNLSFIGTTLYLFNKKCRGN